MDSQKAIFVPGYGVTEAIRAIRFIPKPASIGHAEPRPASSPQASAKLEVWQGDRYGEPTKELLTKFSIADRTATVYSDGEMPLVRPSKSAVAIVHDALHGYEIEFESEFIDLQDRAVRRIVTLDDHGTTRESLCEIKSLAILKSIASRQNDGVRRTASLGHTLGRSVDRLTGLISGFFRLRPSETIRAAQRDIPVEAGGALNRTTGRLPAFTSQSLDASKAPRGTAGRATELEAIPRAAE
jgi:hypothetical protein